jgi:hypothetical protein
MEIGSVTIATAGSWRPHVGYGWRPYTEGLWVYTDLGWTWQSESNGAGRRSTIGRWAYEANNGWIWCLMMYGDRRGSRGKWAIPWCGWAPLPPLVAWESGPAWDVLIPPFCWSFVEVGFLPVRNVREHIVPVARNVTLLHETRNVTQVRFQQRKADREQRSSIPCVSSGRLVILSHVCTWRVSPHCRRIAGADNSGQQYDGVPAGLNPSATASNAAEWSG